MTAFLCPDASNKGMRVNAGFNTKLQNFSKLKIKKFSSY